MKARLFIIPILIAAIPAFGCRKIMTAFSPLVHGSGTVVKSSRTAGAFKGIRIETSVDARVSQGPDQKIELEGEDNILAEIKTEVKDGILVISAEHDYAATRPVTAVIESPTIEELVIDGSGSFKAETPLHAEDFKTEIAGSGAIEANITASKLESTLEGSGDYTLSGKVEKFKGSIEGSGTLHAYDLEAADASVTIDGSGDAEIFCRESLYAQVNGSGDVYYKGSPEKVKSGISGSGTISKK